MNMSAKVFKKESAFAVAQFFIPDLGHTVSEPKRYETFEFAETFDFEPFVEVEPETFDDILPTSCEESGQIVAQAGTGEGSYRTGCREKALHEARAEGGNGSCPAGRRTAGCVCRIAA